MSPIPQRPALSGNPGMLIRCTILLLFTGAMSGIALSEEPAALSSEDVQFFETKIRPALVRYCYECHDAETDDPGGGLLLHTRNALLKGGVTGPALVPGKPDESLLIQALRYKNIEMPPEQPVPEMVLHDFEEWIRRGAPDPRTDSATAPSAKDYPPEVMWAFETPLPPELPIVSDQTWPRNDIDRFVLARIEAAQQQPTVDANPRELIRRLSFDLIGLPPSMDEVSRFAAAWSADPSIAIAAAVDDLLARPQFGERWGRHWLDVARYAESNGNDGLGRNPTFPHAWRYRDYVINAFNADVPYDRFIMEQIAGDLLEFSTDEERDRHLVATGFLAMAAKPAQAMNVNFHMDVVADQIDVVGRGIMGISVACARCHDHKFDPVPTQDYYALAGIFTSSETMWGTAAHEKLTAPPTDLHLLTAAANVPPPEGFEETVLVLDSNTGQPRPIPESRWPVGAPLAMGVRDVKEPKDCQININGNSKKPGDSVPRGFLSSFHCNASEPVAIAPDRSGRLELAHWLTQPDHPLTARVMVNRIWQHLFGDGIVRTPDDFGVYGARPTHPELLDYLAIRFAHDDWSVKQMIRLITTSRTYQLSSRSRSPLESDPPDSSLLTQHRRRRLDAESLRDNMLAVSGQLNLARPDGSIIRHRDILINLAGNLHEPSRHRSVYLCYLRSSPPPELAAFDLPEFNGVTGLRHESTVPHQALHLFNSPFVIEQATHLANRVMQKTDETEPRIQRLWQHVFSRQPTNDEVKDALAFLQTGQESLQSPETAWLSLCQALLLTNEFRYVD